MGNRGQFNGARRRHEGAALVEAAIAITVFLALIFGILEFTLAVFTWARSVEATRAGTRWAIVNDPVCGGQSAIDAGNTVGPCGPNAGLLSVMQRKLPRIDAENVRVTYRPSQAGFNERPHVVPTVTVAVQDISYDFIVPGILGIQASVTLPSFETTRTGEDLDTPASS